MASSISTFPQATASAIITHPVYVLWAPVWKKYIDIYDGIGGFRDGAYLVAHPREFKDWNETNPQIPTKKLLARRKLARYENVAATILDQKRSALFKGEVTRTVEGQSKTQKDNPHPLEDWWENVDGEECTIDQWMAEAFVGAGLFGHLIHYMDRAESDGDTAADQQQPFLRAYTPLDMPDWGLTDRGRLQWVRLQEASPRTDPNQPAVIGPPRERLVTDTYWQLTERAKLGQQPTVTRGEHGFGCVPVVIQYATRRALTQLIGQSILGDPNLYIDLYNLTSEIRELLRAQTFGMLNVPLGTTADRVGIEEAQLMMGSEKGTEDTLFTPGQAAFIQPDSSNVTVYQEEREKLLRTIYRLAAIPWESDSKDAEAEGSLKLKHEDMNQVLASYGQECEKAEYAIAKLWFRSQYGESWEEQWDKAQVKIAYPKTFDVTPFAEMLEQSEAAVSLEMGETFMKELRMSLVPKFLPNLTPETQATIEKELEAAPVKSPAEQKLEEMALRFGGQMPPKGMPPKPGGGGVGV